MSGQGSGIIIDRIFAVADQLQRSNLPPHRTLRVVAQGLGFGPEQMAEMVGTEDSRADAPGALLGGKAFKGSKANTREEAMTTATRTRPKLKAGPSAETLLRRQRQLAGPVLAGTPGAREELQIVDERLKELAERDRLTQLAAEEQELEDAEQRKQQQATELHRWGGDFEGAYSGLLDAARAFEQAPIASTREALAGLDAAYRKFSGHANQRSIAVPDLKTRLAARRAWLAEVWVPTKGLGAEPFDVTVASMCRAPLLRARRLLEEAG